MHTTTASDEIRCPECGAALDIQRDVIVSELHASAYTRADSTLDEMPRRERRTFAVAFCSGCEWCHEVRNP